MGADDGQHRVVVDTNVFVAAGFAEGSDSAEVVQAVRDGRLRMPWTEATRGEVRTVMEKIPPLDWSTVSGLFREEDRVDEPPDEGSLGWVTDAADRKFAALARSEGAVLVSNDDDVLERRSEAGFRVEAPTEYRERSLA